MSHAESEFGEGRTRSWGNHNYIWQGAEAHIGDLEGIAENKKI